MVEAMDTEIGRLLVELGLATWNQDGTLNYQPEKTNTVVVVMGDNGTYVNSVKFTAPGRFDPTRAKAFPYQTGVSRSDEQTSELQSLMRIPYAAFCFKEKGIPFQRLTQT